MRVMDAASILLPMLLLLTGTGLLDGIFGPHKQFKSNSSLTGSLPTEDHLVDATPETWMTITCQPYERAIRALPWNN